MGAATAPPSEWSQCPGTVAAVSASELSGLLAGLEDASRAALMPANLLFYDWIVCQATQGEMEALEQRGSRFYAWRNAQGALAGCALASLSHRLPGMQHYVTVWAPELAGTLALLRAAMLGAPQDTVLINTVAVVPAEQHLGLGEAFVATGQPDQPFDDFTSAVQAGGIVVLERPLGPPAS